VRRLLNADLSRIFRSKWFWLCLGGMLGLSVVFVLMQYTAMDVKVPLSRVIFLPMSFYGLASAALASLFAGEDFSDGFIRSKLIAGHAKCSVFASLLLTVTLACILVYLLTTLFTAAAGCMLFERNVSLLRFVQYLGMGVGMCVACSCICCTLTMLCANKTTAVLLCVGLAFGLLCLCLHTHQVMVQPQNKNGLPNPAYVDGVAKAVYGILHDLNPSGQAAQLSAMQVFRPSRFLLCDLFWLLTAGVGCALFSRKDIA